MTAQIDQTDRSAAASAAKRRVQPPTTRGYGAVVAGLAGLAGVYLVAVIARPDVVTGLFGNGAQETTASPASPEGTAIIADVRRLQTAVGDLRGKVSDLRTDLDKRSEEGRALAVRVSTLDERVATMMTSNLTTASLRTPEPEKVEEKPTTSELEGANVSGKVVEAPVEEKDPPATRAQVIVKNVKTTELRPAVKQEVSVKATPINFGPATVTVAEQDKPRSAVRLAVGPSLDSLRLSWSLLTERHGNLLNTLEARYLLSRSRTAPYQLVVGPLRTNGEAARLCQALRQRGVACSTAAFGGNAL